MPINNQLLEKYTGLELSAKQAVEGFITGLHKSPFHGFSVEFAEHRLYNTGESTRHIDWKLFAKTDKLFVKRYEEETNLRCSILFDVSASMYFGGKDDKSKLEFSTFAAAALCNLLKQQRDAFGLTFFDEKIISSTDIKSNSAHYLHVLSQLESYLKVEPKRTASSPAKIIHQIAETAHRRSLIIIFSDMFENQEDFEALLKALQHLKHNKHEVILFHVLDQEKEIDLNFDNRPYVFVDKETGEEIKLNPQQIQQQYKRNLESHTKSIKNKCAQYKIDYVMADVNQGFDHLLMQYLIRRQKMLY